MLINLTRAGLVTVSHEVEPFASVPKEGADLLALRKRVKEACRVMGAPHPAGLLDECEKMCTLKWGSGKRPAILMLSFSGRVRLTPFGEMFHSACVIGPEQG